MIRANHRPFYVWFFRIYSRVMLWKDFRTVKIHYDGTIPPGPVLLIGNHFSWWDGFIAEYLNANIFRRKLHIMMLEEQLSPRMFLNKAGAFSIRKNSRSVLESLNYGSSIMKGDGNLLVMYPQGEIRSMHHRPVKFEKGLGRIMEGNWGTARIFFYAAIVDYFSHRKPRLDIYLQECSENSADNMERVYHEFIEASVAKQTGD